MFDSQLLDLLLLCAAIAGAIWVFGPPLMFALGLIRVRFLISEDPAAAEPTADDPNFARRYRQFLALGFQPAGTVNETCWFINPMKWYRRSRQPVRWLAAADGKCFATFHRLVPSEPVRFGVVTLTSEGGHVRTTCPGVGEHRADGKYLKVSLRNVEPAELLAAHRDHVDVFCRQRDTTVRAATFVEAATVEEEHTRYLLPKLGNASLYQIPVLYFFLPAFLVTGYARHLGYRSDDWHVWAVAACVGAAVFAFIKFVVMPASFQRAALRHHHAGNAE